MSGSTDRRVTFIAHHRAGNLDILEFVFRLRKGPLTSWTNPALALTSDRKEKGVIETTNKRLGPPSNELISPNLPARKPLTAVGTGNGIAIAGH